jgi:regulator of sigma E protease
MAFLQGWVGLILGFSGLIFIHELGHFALAKWNGVRVYVFSLGMGPYLISFSWRGTVYALSLIPIGGYVKLQGQDDLNPNEAQSKDPHDYRNKRPGQKAAILAAGAAFNLIFTIFIFTVCYLIGMNIEPPFVGSIEPDKPLARATLETDPSKPADLREGDEILAVNGVPVRRFLDANLQIAGSPRSEPLRMRVKRSDRSEKPGEIIHISVMPELDTKQAASSIGLNPYFETLRLQLGFKTEDSLVVAADPRLTTKDNPNSDKMPAARAGLNLGDEILKLEFPEDPAKSPISFAPRPNDPAPYELRPNEKDSLDLVSEIRHHIRLSEGRLMRLTVRRAGEPSPILIELKAEKAKEKDASYLIGAVFSLKHRVTEVSEKSEIYKAGLRKDHYVYAFVSDPKKEVWNSTGRRFVPKVGKLVWSPEWTTDEKLVTQTELDTTADSSTLTYRERRLYRIECEAMPIGEAISAAWGDTVRYSASVFTVLKGLFTGTVGASALSGPAGIGQVMYAVASSQAFWKYMWFLGFISLNLGVLQFVPIPLLDGWHLLMVLIEKLKGSPVQPRVQEVFQYVGLFLIGGLLLMATFNDIRRIFN